MLTTLFLLPSDRYTDLEIFLLLLLLFGAGTPHVIARSPAIQMLSPNKVRGGRLGQEHECQSLADSNVEGHPHVEEFLDASN